MSSRSVLLWVLIPFLGLCALALWLTRPAPPQAPAETRKEQGSAPAVPSSSPVIPQPGGSPQAPAATPAAPPRAPPPPPVSIPEAEPQQESSEQPSVDKEELRRAIQTAFPLILQCFEDVAERYPGPQTVKIKFTIEGQGLTGKFKDGQVVDSTIQDPFAQACFLDSLMDVRFPAPQGGGRVTITYPFHFQPRGGAGR